jgi:hypothetical protein
MNTHFTEHVSMLYWSGIQIISVMCYLLFSSLYSAYQNIRLDVQPERSLPLHLPSLKRALPDCLRISIHSRDNFFHAQLTVVVACFLRIPLIIY